MDPLDQFTKKQYVNLETFRKSGEGVRTPVWFCREADVIYILTYSNSGKMKRIRRNGRVNIVPCKINGTPTGQWMPAFASEVTEPETVQKADRLMNKKYGLQKKLVKLNATRPDGAVTVVEVKLADT